MTPGRVHRGIQALLQGRPGTALTISAPRPWTLLTFAPVKISPEFNNNFEHNTCLRTLLVYITTKQPLPLTADLYYYSERKQEGNIVYIRKKE